MFFYHDEAIATPCEEGVMRRVLSYSEEMMLCEITFKKGAAGTVHSHPHLQLTYVVSGSFQFTVNGETKVVNAGDSLCIPSTAVHGTMALEDGVLIDIFHPKREEFL